MNHRRLPPPSRYHETSPMQPPRFGYNHPQSMNSVPPSQHNSRYIGPQSPSNALQSPLGQFGGPLLDSFASQREHSSYGLQTLDTLNPYQDSYGRGHQHLNDFVTSPAHSYNHSQLLNDFAPYPPSSSGPLYSESLRTQPALSHSDLQPPYGFSRQPLPRDRRCKTSARGPLNLPSPGPLLQTPTLGFAPFPRRREAHRGPAQQPR